MRKAKVNTLPFWRFLFLCYCAIMIWLLFFENRGATYENYWAQVKGNYNKVPLYTIRTYLRVIHNSKSGYWVRHCAINLIGNIVLFIPGGFLFPRLYRKFRPFWRALLQFFVMLVAIELLQLFTLLGRLDVDDVILNLTGLCIGYGIYAIFR